MKAARSRGWIAFDEWMGAILLIWLCPPEWRKYAFLGGLAWWFFCIYIVSYPSHWIQCYLERRKGG